MISWIKHNCLIFIIIFGITGCDSGNGIQKEVYNIPDSLIKNSPEYEFNINSIGSDRYLNDLDLPSLHGGFSDYYLRVWEVLENDTGLIYILRLKNKQWSGEKLQFIIHAGEPYIDSLSTLERFYFNDQKQLQLLAERIFDLKIHELPDFTGILNYDLDTDEVGIRIEMAKKNYYKVVNYPGASSRRQKFKEAETAMQLLNLLETAMAKGK